MNQTEFEGLPLQQRKAAQQRLIDQGLYVGRPDGRWGGGTEAAFKAEDRQRVEREAAERDAKAKSEERALEAERLRQSGKTTDVEAAAAAAETARRQRYEDESSSGLGLTTQSAANIAAPAAATAGGMLVGKGVNAGMDYAQRGRNEVLRGVADDRMAGRTTVEGARQGATVAGAMPPSNRLMRVGSRMAPHLGLGAFSAGKGLQLYADSFDPDSEFYPQMANRAAGLGYIGFGAGLAKQGVRQAASPGVTPDAQAIAIINSNRLIRNGAQAPAGPPPDVPPPPPSPPSGPVRHSERLRNAATAAGAKPGKSKGSTYTALAKNLDDSNIADVARALDLPETVGKAGVLQRARELARTGGKSAILAPLAAAGAAFGMTPDRAEAAGAAPDGGVPAEALTNAGVAGGAAYGANRLLAAIPRGGGSMFGEAMAPTAVDAMTDYSPDEMATGANWQMRNMPEWAMSPSVKQTYQMAQIPEPSPYRNDAFDAQLSELNALLGETQ